jgi:hypothetical protein
MISLANELWKYATNPLEARIFSNTVIAKKE